MKTVVPKICRFIGRGGGPSGYRETYLDPGGQYGGSENERKGLQPRVLPRQMKVGGSDWRVGLGSERRPTSQAQSYRLCWRNGR